MAVAAVPDADEDEEGEVQDAQVTEHAEGGEAAPDNMQVCEQCCTTQSTTCVTHSDVCM